MKKLITMSSEKAESIILSISPYRETSCILRLFTRSRGLIHGIAKGVRKSGKSSTPLDRGFLLESQLYYKPNRELHTLGSLHVTNFFSGIRPDLTKSAIRDVALELYLKSITQSDSHPELFNLMISFFVNIEESQRREILFPLLWRFIYRYCSLMGFGIDVYNCKTCGIGVHGDIMDVADTNANICTGIGTDTVHKYYLEIEAGALTCKKCVSPKSKFNALANTSNRIEQLRVTELLLLYCCHHLDITACLNSFDFIRSIH